MFALLYYLQYLLLLYLIFPSLIINQHISHAQYFTSNFDYRRRPSNLKIIGSIKKLRPFKATGIITETFDRQIKQSSQIMDNSIVEYSRNQLQNVTGQIYVRPIIKSSKTRATKRINHALPKAISPFLQIFDDDDREERPITVKPKLQSTTTTATAITTITATAATTITTATSTATTATPPSTATTTATTTTASAAATATLATTITTTTTTTTTLLATTIGITPLTTYPIILSRLSPEADIEAKRSRIQARWRKLGPLIHSIQYPYARRNWRPVVLTDGDNSFHFSNRIKQIIKQRLEQQQQLQQQQQQQQQRRQQQQQQQEMKQINAEKFEKRPRVGGILLSNAKIKSRIFTSKEVDEWPKEIVQPITTTTAFSTITNATTTIPIIDFTTEITSITTETTAATSDIIFTDITSAIMITPPPTTTISTTSSSSSISSSSSSSDSSIASSRLINFESISSTIEPKSFSFSTSANDYHFRRVTPAKKFKFAQKFRRQPRLKIRKSEEGGPLRGNKTAFGRSPIILPHLAPLNLENDIQQIKLDNDENDFSSNSDTSSNSNDLIESTDNLDPSTNGLLSESGKIETGFRNGKFPTFGQGLVEFDGGRPPPVDFNEPSFGVFGSDNHKQPEDHFSTTDNPNRLSKTTKEIVSTNSPIETTSLMTSSTTTVERLGPPQPAEPILKNSGLLPALPPSDFIGEFGTGRGRIPMQNAITGGVPSMDDSIFTGDSALVPNRFGPTGDGLGPPIPSGAAIPPPVPALGIGGLAAGILPTLSDDFLKTQTAPTTVKPSALLSFLTKADVGLNQAINHFEQGTPVESAAIDILEVALGSEKLDSQAKLLGHIDRTIGIDNIQRLQRWANAGGAMDALKEQLVKIVKNYTVPPNLLPTIPPQLEYLFAPGRKKHI